MPIHIYECGDCSTREDYLVSRDQIPRNCANCGGESLTRIYEGQTFGARTSDKGVHRRKEALVPTGRVSSATVVEAMATPFGIIAAGQKVPAIEYKRVFPQDN